MRAYRVIEQKPYSLKRAMITGALTLILTAGSVGAYTACDCNDNPPINGNGSVNGNGDVNGNGHVEPNYNIHFEKWIPIINQQNPNLADTLIELYKEKEEAATNLSILYQYNPEIVEFLADQPWFNDGLSLEEEIFINCGLGGHPDLQGVGATEGIEEIIKEIIENQQYRIETIQLSGGTKNVLIMCEDPQYLDLAMEKTKESMPLIENFLGITYPKQTLTIFVAEGLFTGASNGTVYLDISYLINNITQPLYHEGTHAMWDTDQDGGRGGGTKWWINEGLAELGAYVTGEQLNTTISLQEKYEI